MSNAELLYWKFKAIIWCFCMVYLFHSNDWILQGSWSRLMWSYSNLNRSHGRVIWNTFALPGLNYQHMVKTHMGPVCQTEDTSSHWFSRLPHSMPWGYQSDAGLYSTWLFNRGIYDPQLVLYVLIDNLAIEYIHWNGTKILDNAWSGEYKCNFSYQWPLMMKPSPGKWKIWQTNSMVCFSLNQWHSWTWLGCWYPSMDSWGWFFDPKTSRLWHQEAKQWRCHGQIPLWSRTLTFHARPIPNEYTPPLRALQHVTIHFKDWNLWWWELVRCKLSTLHQWSGWMQC